MKALTLWQPWATLVALGHKTLETRSWSTEYRGPLAIHAGKATSQLYLHREYPYTQYLADYRQRFPLGCVVAICNLVDVWEMPNSGEWVLHRVLSSTDMELGNSSHGRYGWRLEDIIAVDPPVEARGRQQLWNWDSPLQALLLRQWEASQGTRGVTKLRWRASDSVMIVTRESNGQHSPASSMTTEVGDAAT